MSVKLLDLDGWESRVKFVFDSVRTDCMSWPQTKQLLDAHIYPELERRKQERKYYGAYVHGLVHGMIRAYQSMFYSQFVEFCYQIDGALYTVNRVDSLRPHIDLLFEVGRGHELGTAPCGFYWKTQDKLYFSTTDPTKMNEVPR